MGNGESNSSMSDVRDKINGLERNLEGALEEKREIEKVKYEKELEIRILKGSLNNIQGEISEVRSILSQVSKERDEFRDRINGLGRNLERVVEEKRDSEKVTKEKESEIRILNGRLNKLHGEISEVRCILSQVSKERDEFRSQFEPLMEIENLLRNKLEGEISEVRSTLSRVSKERDEAKARLEDQIEIENGLRLRLTETEKKEMLIQEKARKIKVDYDELLEEKTSIEGKMDSILREKDSIERSLIESNRLVDKLRSDISEISNENMVIQAERNLLEKTKTNLESLANELNELVHKLQNRKEQFLHKVADLEKKCVVSSEKVAKMSTKIDILLKGKQEIEETIQKVTQEKSMVTKDLNEVLKMLEDQKLTIDQLLEEKMKINDAKRQGEANIMKLEKQLENFKNTILTLENSTIHQTNTIKQLESEVSRQKTVFDQVTKERNIAQASLVDKRNSLWTMVSSTTTSLAIVSLANVARRCKKLFNKFGLNY